MNTIKPKAGNTMNLLQIESALQSAADFKEYISSEGEGGSTALTLGLIIDAIEVDGASLTDFELLDIIGRVIDLHRSTMKEGESK